MCVGCARKYDLDTAVRQRDFERLGCRAADLGLHAHSAEADSESPESYADSLRRLDPLPARNIQDCAIAHKRSVKRDERMIPVAGVPAQVRLQGLRPAVER